MSARVMPQPITATALADAGLGLYQLVSDEGAPIREVREVYDLTRNIFETGPAIRLVRVRQDDGQPLPLGCDCERRNGKQWIAQWVLEPQA